MTAKVSYVKPNSIAEDLEIKPGDELLYINEKKPEDLIDYKNALQGEEVSIHIKRISGEEEIIDIEIDPGEDLGIIFEQGVFDRIIPCTNKCIFCFVDQQPEGMRDTLYIKDDDYRLSYLDGTYITLTNLTDEQKKRIEELKLGPLYVSVHTTNPELRVKMLKNPRAAEILNHLKWLNGISIPIHTQLVLCPGYNDGEELEKSLSDLAELKSNIESIAIVPVGLTKFRDNNDLRTFTPEEAVKVLQQVKDFNKKIGYSLAIPSDEFFIKAGESFPKNEFYRGYGQIEDGVGTARLLIDDYNRHKKELPKKLSKKLELTLVTGELAANILKPIVDDLKKTKNLFITLVPVKSTFWGEKVTVSGLVTGKDLLDQLIPMKDRIERLVLPSVMLKANSNVFLDGITLEEIRDELDTNIEVIENHYSVVELIDIIKYSTNN